MDPVQRKQYQRRFSTIEASFRIEGMDPSGDALYETAKAKVLSGEMTPEEAHAFVVRQTGDRSRLVAAAF
ncbi:MAG: antitoxin VbhA family protein [Acidobacteriaceae bacterium]